MKIEGIAQDPAISTRSGFTQAIELEPILTRERNGAPGAIRTPDPQIRSLVLYPAELRVRLPCGEGGSLARGSGGRKRGNAVLRR